MKILVTGSEGSLMQATIPKLVDKHAVYGVDNLFRYGERLGRATDYDFIKADLTDRPSVENLVKQIKPDVIIQAAARIYSVGGFNKYCADILGEDIQLHNNVLRAAVDAGVPKVVYISSSMVYETGTGVMKEEDIDTVAVPRTEYGLSKFFCEKLSIAFKKQYDMDYTLWRPFNILTPYERKEAGHGMSHVFADFIDEIVIKRNEVLPILGDGKQIRCFTWIDEVAGAIADYSTSDKSTGEAFNVANLEPITMMELAQKIRRIAEEEFLIPYNKPLTFEHKPSYNNDVRYRVPDVTKIKDVLGWEAKMKVDDALRLCIKDALEINNVKI